MRRERRRRRWRREKETDSPQHTQSQWAVKLLAGHLKNPPHIKQSCRQSSTTAPYHLSEEAEWGNASLVHWYHSIADILHSIRLLVGCEHWWTRLKLSKNPPKDELVQLTDVWRLTFLFFWSYTFVFLSIKAQRIRTNGWPQTRDMDEEVWEETAIALVYYLLKCSVSSPRNQQPGSLKSPVFRLQ